MARINIEDQFWIEVAVVTKRLRGDESRAVGDAIRLFRIAQQRAKNKQIVTDQDWAIGEFTDALIGVFAFKVEGGYEVAGSKKHFSWLEERVENGRKGGKASGKSRANKINNLGEANASKGKQAEASPSLSSSPSMETDNKLSVSVQQTQKIPLNNNSATQNFNARFHPQAQDFLGVLDNFGLKERLQRYLGHIINSFSSPQALQEFIDLKATCEACKAILKECNGDAIKARPRIEQFVIVCLKREIGALSENTQAI